MDEEGEGDTLRTSTRGPLPEEGTTVQGGRTPESAGGGDCGEWADAAAAGAAVAVDGTSAVTAEATGVPSSKQPEAARDENGNFHKLD
ncbi:hypothetical protein SKAU_G00418790 [Synaphobranchus kaupii]|uniref:Uncharacterized protein n=1 Tax=Synaphobranchus kaupii TaxID=118154 RepID=A0A9Q1I924_SYNKA|nr:hypothetical protein SKAU_G00418790 [Synaphobranchus kaupii]